MSAMLKRIRVAGHPEGDLIVDSLMSQCGQIKDGVAMRFEEKRGGFVVDLEDLRAVVQAADEYQAANSRP